MHQHAAAIRGHTKLINVARPIRIQNSSCTVYINKVNSAVPEPCPCKNTRQKKRDTTAACTDSNTKEDHCVVRVTQCTVYCLHTEHTHTQAYLVYAGEVTRDKPRVPVLRLAPMKTMRRSSKVFYHPSFCKNRRAALKVL